MEVAKKVRLNQAVNPPTTDSAEQHTHVEDNKVSRVSFCTIFRLCTVQKLTIFFLLFTSGFVSILWDSVCSF